MESIEELAEKYAKESERQLGVYMKNKDNKDTHSIKTCISALSKKEVLDSILKDLHPFIEGYNQALPKWIDAKERLPDFIHEHSGNKLSDTVLAWDGYETHKLYLEAVRPDFKTLIWSYPSMKCNADFDSEDFDFKGTILKWTNLPTPPQH